MNYQQLMINDLQDLYQAETEQASQLQQLASQVNDERLRAVLLEHAQETQQQAMRLTQVLQMVGDTPGGSGRVPAGVRGLVAEAHEKAATENPYLQDLAIIAAAQKMEHYEIACYGTARAMARTAGLDEAARLLQTTLDEEEAADRRLTDVAMPIHKQAAQQLPAMAM